MRRPAVLLATGFGIGWTPFAPATAASLVVALVLVRLGWMGPSALLPLPLGIATVLLVPLAIWSSGDAERDLGTDAHPIVVDEVVGMLVSVWGIARLNAPSPALLLGAAFVLFRFFDIVKPFPIRQSQRLPAGTRAIAEGLIAGIAVDLVLRLLVAVASH